MKLRNKIILSTALTAAIVAGVWVKSDIDASKTGCVNVVVDFGKLSITNPEPKCLSVDGTPTALKLFKTYGLTLTGTDKYGDQIVCLVNGLPKKADCTDMPPENAYWAIFVKHPGAVSEWGWADKGVADLELKAGDSLALSYTVDGKVKWPK